MRPHRHRPHRQLLARPSMVAPTRSTSSSSAQPRRRQWLQRLHRHRDPLPRAALVPDPPRPCRPPAAPGSSPPARPRAPARRPGRGRAARGTGEGDRERVEQAAGALPVPDRPEVALPATTQEGPGVLEHHLLDRPRRGQRGEQPVRPPLRRGRATGRSGPGWPDRTRTGTAPPGPPAPGGPAAGCTRGWCTSPGDPGSGRRPARPGGPPGAGPAASAATSAGTRASPGPRPTARSGRRPPRRARRP
ncbi:hypothetical protein SMICM304S_08407 [Streptomyces microflavus]